MAAKLLVCLSVAAVGVRGWETPPAIFSDRALGASDCCTSKPLSETNKFVKGRPTDRKEALVLGQDYAGKANIITINANACPEDLTKDCGDGKGQAVLDFRNSWMVKEFAFYHQMNIYDHWGNFVEDIRGSGAKFGGWTEEIDIKTRATLERLLEEGPPDPCDTDNGGCVSPAKCSSFEGTVTCACPNGYSNDQTGKECVEGAQIRDFNIKSDNIGQLRCLQAAATPEGSPLSYGQCTRWGGAPRRLFKRKGSTIVHVESGLCVTGHETYPEVVSPATAAPDVQPPDKERLTLEKCGGDLQKWSCSGKRLSLQGTTMTKAYLAYNANRVVACRKKCIVEGETKVGNEYVWFNPASTEENPMDNSVCESTSWGDVNSAATVSPMLLAVFAVVLGVVTTL